MDVARTSLMARILTELRERRTITCKVDMPKEMAIRFDATVGQMVELIQLGPALGLLIIKRGQSGKQVMIRGSFGWSELDTDADRRKAVLKVLRQAGGRFYSGYQEGSMLDGLAIWLGILPDSREHSEDLVVLRAAIDELSISSALMRHIVEGQLVGIYLLEKGPLEIKPLRAAGRSANSERDLLRTKLAERVDGKLDLEGKPISMTVAHWLSISDHRAKQLLREFVEQEVDVKYTCNSQGDIVELWLDGTNSGAPRGPGIDEEAAVANTPADQAAADVPAYSPLVRRLVYFLGSMGGRLEDGERTVNLQIREGLGLDQANASSSVWVAEKAGAIVKKMITPRKTRSIELSKQARAWLAANPDPSFIALPIPPVASMVVGGSDTPEEPAAEEPAADAALHLLAARPAELPVPSDFGRGDADLDDLFFLGAERLLRIIELERAAARLFAEARELGARIQAMSQESTRMRDEAAKLRAEELNPDLMTTILDRAEEVRRRLGIA